MVKSKYSEGDLIDYIYYAVRSHNGPYCDEEIKKECECFLDNLIDNALPQ